MTALWLVLLGCGPTPDAARHEPRAERLVKTFTVDCAGGADYPSIDRALKEARSGDVLRVAPCTYPGSIHFEGKSVRIESTGGAAVTTIVGTPGEPAIKANDGEDAGTTVSGFTITGGGGPLEPAIEVQFSSLTLRDVVVTGNAGTTILYSHAGHVLVERAIFADNTASEGMVIQERRGMTVLKDSTVRCGSAAIGYIVEHGVAFVDGSTFDCRGAIGVEVYHADGRVQRTVVDGLLRVENEQLEQSERAIVEDVVLLGGASIEAADVTLRNTVSLGPITALDSVLLVEASIVTGAACGVRSDLSTVTIRSSDLWANTRDTCGDVSMITIEASFAADPRFRGDGDYRLSPGSPCIDAGPTAFGYADPDGSRNDLGAFGGPLSLGGGW